MPETATASERYHLFIPTEISARNIVFEISLKAAGLLWLFSCNLTAE